MDSSTASIIAALISAAASVLIALIGKTPAADPRRHSPVPVNAPQRNKRAWAILIAALVIWLFASPPLIHWDWLAMNFFLLPVVTLVLSAAWPIKASWAAAIVLLLYPINFLLFPIEWQLRPGGGHGMDTRGVVLMLAVAFVNAGLSWGICRWLRRGNTLKPDPVQESYRSPNPAPHIAGSIADEIEKLNALRASGALSDEEFQKIKQRLIDSRS